MEIERTSKIINSMLEECYDDDIDINSFENWEEQIQFMFNSFSYKKILKIDYASTKDFLLRFNKIYKNGIFSSFKEPISQEYFCKQLNFLLLIDFILTFFRVDDRKFDVKRLTTEFIFDFFCKLGDFYSFMNFLDVDDAFVNYLKYMLTLYSFQLDRKVIEEQFHYHIEVLDHFFMNELMPKVFADIKYKNYNGLVKQIEEYGKKFSAEIKEYNANNCYDSEAYAYLDDLFTLDKDWNSLPRSVIIKTKTIEVMNPNPPPMMHNVYVADNDNSDDDDDDDSYYGSDDEYHYIGSLSHSQPWTTIIKKQVPIIQKEDSNYEEYRKLFVLRNYQKVKLNYDIIKSEIKSLCSTLRIKKYDSFEPNNNTSDILKIKTILGCVLDYKSVSENDYKTIFGLACEYGHIDIIKALMEKKNGDIGDLNFEKAQASPNRDIPRYLIECKGKYKKIKDLFDKYKDVNYYEPKIRFN